MELEITLTMDNAAFTDDINGEVCRILRRLAGSIKDNTTLESGDEFGLFDINGNRVGKAVVSE